jgi:hypothetical protein
MWVVQRLLLVAERLAWVAKRLAWVAERLAWVAGALGVGIVFAIFLWEPWNEDGAKFDAWTSGLAAIATIIAIVIGGGWAAWRYLVPHPFQTTWDIVTHCTVREQETGHFRYIAEIDLINTSDIVYTVEMIGISLVFPDEQPPSGPAQWIPAGPQLQGMFAPRAKRQIFISRAGGDILHHVVTLRGEVRYRRPRWFGLLGHRSKVDGMGFLRVTPVDIESLTLYMRASKENSATLGH